VHRVGERPHADGLHHDPHEERPNG
jgi:hypothetical protein